MKKLGLLVFLVAIIGSVALVWGITGRTFGGFNFSFNSVRGSGNIKTEKREVSGFKGIDASSAFTLEVTVGKEFSVEVETDDNLLQFVKTEVSDGVLHLKLEKNNIWGKNRHIARVTMPQLESLELSGAVRATVAGVKSENLKISASGASRLDISGETQKLDVDLSGASRVEAAKLNSQRAAIDVSGASRANVFVTESLNAEASGASRVSYAGNPKEVKENESGASRISAN